MSTFVAIDFETATSRRDSACAVGLAAGCDGRIAASRTCLIRPPTPAFSFTGIHGMRWEDVCDAPTFEDLWPALRAWIEDAEFLAAHNAPFDRSILLACCARYRLRHHDAGSDVEACARIVLAAEAEKRRASMSSSTLMFAGMRMA